ncbi:hypothetical protein FPQ37_20350 [Burkholderia contaminans]|nr:hypothetical protein FPQ37_20350 [Burkholderia contaminans]
MEGFLMRVTARDAPSRIDEARPYYPPNEDDETEGAARNGAARGSPPCGGEGAGGPKPLAG